MATALTRFMAKIDQNHKTGCWEWTAYTSETGYARYQNRQAHHWSYEHFRGPIPLGYQVHHVCSNRVCVNPEHLEALSVSDHGKTRRRDVCRNGHEFVDGNLYVRSNGKRYCRQCRIDYHRNTKGRDSTVCKNGHPRTPENTQIGSDGRRFCILCLGKRANQTHCKRGHPLNGNNIFIDSKGGRICKTCLSVRQRAFYVRHRKSRMPQACARGHAFTPHNTILTATGRRSCRTCRDERRKRPIQRTHCRNGHPLSGSNLYIAADRQHVCRTCRSSYDHARHTRQRMTCKHGHTFTAENTIFRSGRRYCRTCREQKQTG